MNEKWFKAFKTYSVQETAEKAEERKKVIDENKVDLEKILETFIFDLTNYKELPPFKIERKVLDRE